MTACSVFTLQDIISKNALLYGDEVGFVEGNIRWTFEEFAEKVQKFAFKLTSVGLNKGDRVAILAFNSLDFLVLHGAIAWLGLIMVPINWRLKPDEMKVILKGCTPKAIIAGPDYMETAAQIVAQCPFIVHRVTFGDSQMGFISFKEIENSGDLPAKAKVTHKDPFVIIHTAAVGKNPKGAVLTHNNFIMSAMHFMGLMNLTSDDTYLNLLPYFHIGGLGAAWRIMQVGGRNIILRRFNDLEAAELIEKEKVTFIEIFSPMLAQILDQAQRSQYDLSSLRVVAGLEHPDTIRRCENTTGAVFWTGFGQTETTGFCTSSPFYERPGSAGREGPLTRISIVDDSDRELPMGQPGEITVRGPLVFQEYWNMKKETEYTARGGHHHTGDIGRLDEKGYLWYLKRKAEKELIKTGGENVYPAEVEAALLEHSDVVEACVFGVPDSQWGEAIYAACVPKQGSTPDPQSVIDFVADRIARYKKPKYLAFYQSLPKNETGDLDREKMKTILEQNST